MWWKCSKCNDEIIATEEQRTLLRNGKKVHFRCSCGELDFQVSLKLVDGIWTTITEGKNLPKETIKKLND